MIFFMNEAEEVIKMSCFSKSLVDIAVYVQACYTHFLVFLGEGLGVL
jgi:hypothetical protein